MQEKSSISKGLEEMRLRLMPNQSIGHLPITYICFPLQVLLDKGCSYILDSGAINLGYIRRQSLGKVAKLRYSMATSGGQRSASGLSGSLFFLDGFRSLWNPFLRDSSHLRSLLSPAVLYSSTIHNPR